MEIAELHTRFVEVPDDLQIAAIAELLSALPAATRRDWYVVVRLAEAGRQVVRQADGSHAIQETPPPGFAAILPVKDLAAAWQRHGESLWTLTLAAAPGLLRPALVMERSLMGAARARRDWEHRSWANRLVVVEHGQVVGLLTNEDRAGGFGGVPVTLYGRERPLLVAARSRITYRCPVDGGIYDFADLLDPASDRLICPNGHVIQE